MSMRVAMQRSKDEAEAKAAALLEAEHKVLHEKVTALLSSPDQDLETVTLRFVRERMAETCDFEVKPHKKFIKSVVTGYIDAAVAKKTKEAAQRRKRAAARKKAAAKKKPKAVAKKTPSSSKGKKRKKPSSASKKGGENGEPKKKRKPANQPKKPLSAALAVVVGAKEMSRPQVVKHIWIYIRANALQDPADKRRIICDAKLKKVMGGEKTVTMFRCVARAACGAR